MSNLALPFSLTPVVISFVGQVTVAIVGLVCRWRRAALVRAVIVSLIIQAVAVGWALTEQLALPTVLALAGVIGLLGFAAEWCGVRWGFPFGRYHYTTILRPQLAGIPLPVVLAWWVVSLPAFAIPLSLTTNPLLQILISAQLVAALDLFIDPTFVQLQFWQWARRGRIFGIPLVNYCGWFLTAAVMCAALRLLLPTFSTPPHPTLIAIYTLNLLLQSIAVLMIWPWREWRIVPVAFPLLSWPLLLLYILR